MQSNVGNAFPFSFVITTNGSTFKVVFPVGWGGGGGFKIKMFLYFFSSSGSKTVVYLV